MISLYSYLQLWQSIPIFPGPTHSFMSQQYTYNQLKPRKAAAEHMYSFHLVNGIQSHFHWENYNHMQP